MLPGFSAESSIVRASFEPRGSANAFATCCASRPAVSPARIAHRTTYGCGIDWHNNLVCCRFWQPSGDVVICCPRDSSGPCGTYLGFSAQR